MKDQLTNAQKLALDQLDHALQEASDSGLFDTGQMWDLVGPDEINVFCDGVSEVVKACK